MTPKTFLFAIIPEKGHVNPYIGPAQALVELGHRVTIAAPGDIAQQVGRAGLQFDDGLVGRTNGDRPTCGKELVDLIQDAARLRVWIDKLLLDDLDAQVGVCRKLLGRVRPDAVVVDPLYYAAAIAASCENMPWFSVSNSLNPVIPDDMKSDLLQTIAVLAPKRLAAFKRFGMSASFRGCDILSPLLTLAFTTEEFVGPAPRGVQLVGPSLPLHRRGDESGVPQFVHDRPMLYASFGSQIYHWPEIFEKLVEVTSTLQWRAAFSVGELAGEPRWQDLPRHCEAFRYAPQLELLKHASAFISHGGANSVMEAISCGVPLLISPMCNDQFHQAEFVRRSGIGAVLDLRTASVSDVVFVLRSVTESPKTRQAMLRVQQSYRCDGARRAATLIVEALER